MLDEVDVISSVSGGSFTSAYYALFRDRIFTDYEKEFLKRNVQARLAWSAINPLMWIPLASPYYSRIDMAAEIYDDMVFKGKTFADLAAQPRRPYIILNSTDMSTAQRVEFTQEFFDLFHSDVGGVPVARAVAASSAFPILLSPLTINNYRIDNGYVEPSWVADALEEREENPTRYDRARMVRSYLTDNRPFIHLLDGGLSDNIGLRGPWMSMSSPDVLDGDEGPDGAESVHGLNILRLMQTEKDRIKTLVVIVVNARPAGGTGLDTSKATPGVISVFDTVTGGPMGNYSSDTVQLFQQDMDKWNAEQEDAKKDGEPFYPVEFFQVQLNFDGVSDPKLRDICNGAGTNYSLTDAQVDALRQAAKDAMRNSTKFQEILTRLQEPSRQEGREPLRRAG
jgi:NTE family protein